MSRLSWGWFVVLSLLGVDTLIEMLGHAGARVSVVVTPRSKVA